MKLFVIAALVAVAAAGRLEHLERSYLPPDSNAIGSERSSFGSNGGFGSPRSNGGFGSPSSHGGFASPSSHGSFGANSGAFGASGAGPLSRNAGSSFAGATSNQYLPPDHGPSASNGVAQFARSSQGFGGQNFRSQQHSGHMAGLAQQYGAPQASSSFSAPRYQAAPAQQYGAPQASSSFSAPRYQAAPAQQYGAPQASSSFSAPRYQAAPAQQYGAPQAGSSFGAPSYQAQFPQQSATSRQYLAPKASSFQNPPQQAFDEQTGYHY